MEPLLVRFVKDYGWRAYAIPVLLVITVWVFVDVFRDASGATENVDGPARENTSAHQTVTPAEKQQQSSDVLKSTAPSSLRGGPNPASIIPPVLPSGELPPGGPYTEKGTGLFRLAGVPGPKFGEGREKTVTYTVEIEEGINPSAFGGDFAFAAMVDATLAARDGGNPRNVLYGAPTLYQQRRNVRFGLRFFF